MELLATALSPYSSLPTEALASVLVLVVIGGATVIFAISEIITRGTWNRHFHEKSSLGLGPVLRSHARRRGPHNQRRTPRPTA